MKKVVIVAPVHVWDDVRVYEKEATSLACHGYKVSLIARADQKKVCNDVTVVPVIYQGSSRIIRIISLPLVALQAICLKGNVYHLHNPDTLLIGIVLKFFGKKVVYDTHEDFTKRILSRKWVPRWLKSPLAYTVGIGEKYFSRIFDLTLCTQESVATRLGKDNCVIVGNPPRINKNLLASVDDLAKYLVLKKCDFRISYIGTVNQSRGLFEMVDALPIINKDLDCRLSLVGPAEEDELDLVKCSPGWKYVDYVERVSQEIAFSYIKRSDVGLIYIRDEGGHSEIDPNKIYEYMAFSKPFVASNFTTWVDKFGHIGAGIFVDPGNSHLLAEAIIVIARKNKSEREEMGRKGHRFTLETSWESEFSKVLDGYQSLFKK